LHAKADLHSPRSPDDPVIAGEEAVAGCSFGTGQMGGIQRPKALPRERARPCRHLLRDSNVDHRTWCPPRNFDAPIRQRVLCILKRKDSRPDQPVNPIDDPLQDHKDGGGFLGNAVLTLIIERAVKAIQIQI
jgi:hypothetical protein